MTTSIPFLPAGTTPVCPPPSFPPLSDNSLSPVSAAHTCMGVQPSTGA